MANIECFVGRVADSTMVEHKARCVNLADMSFGILAMNISVFTFTRVEYVYAL